MDYHWIIQISVTFLFRYFDPIFNNIKRIFKYTILQFKVDDYFYISKPTVTTVEEWDLQKLSMYVYEWSKHYEKRKYALSLKILQKGKNRYKIWNEDSEIC